MIIKYLQLIDLQAKMKMKAQANKLMLSYIWWVLEPLLLVALFYIVFGYILQRGGEDFLSFLIIGKIIFMWFSKSVTSASTAIISNKGIISQRNLPKWVFPMVNIHESMYKSIFSFTVMFILLFYQGYNVNYNWIQLIPLTLTMYILICGVGMFFSILVCVAKDFSNLISLLMMGLMFGSGIFWDVNSIGNKEVVDLLYTFNPLLTLISSYRDVILYEQSINFYEIINSFLFSLAMLFFSLYLLVKFNNKITKMVF